MVRHLKNSFIVQRDINNITNTVRGQLHKLSVPVNISTVPNLDPLGYNPDPRGQQQCTCPQQLKVDNLAVMAIKTYTYRACVRPYIFGPSSLSSTFRAGQGR